MTTSRIVLVLAALAVLFVASMAIFKVDQRQTALVMHFGEVSRIVDDPGLHVNWPIADVVVDIENRIV